MREVICLKNEDASGSTLVLAASFEFFVLRTNFGFASELGDVPHTDCAPFIGAFAFVGFWL